MTSTLRRQFLYNDEYQLKMRFDNVDNSICEALKDEYKIPNLCLAGGVALNCVANGKILLKNIFQNIWVQPAAGDAGGSLGAALAYWHLELNKERSLIEFQDSMEGSYLGPSYSNSTI